MLKTIRKRTRRTRHWLLWRLVALVEWCFCRLPWDFAVALGGALGRVAFYLDFADRRRAFSNLELAFGSEMDTAQRRRIARGVFENLGRSAAEICLARRFGTAFLRERIVFRGQETPQRFMAEGKGWLFVTAHLDNWELLGAGGAALLGFPVLAVAQRQSDAAIEEWLQETRRRLGMRIHLRGSDARTLLRSLRSGEALSVLLDQDTDGAGCFVPFLGRPAFTLLGPALLALRADVPVVVALSRRNPDKRTHTMTFEPAAIPQIADEGLTPAERRDAQARELTRRLTARIEQAVLEAPDQWVWFHRRWRRRPDPAEPVPPRGVPASRLSARMG